MKLTIDDLRERTSRVATDDLDLETFRDHPLDEPTLRCLRYMHDVEHNTIIYLRDVLVTDAHFDHEITSFLTFWAFEEYFHGEAIGRVLEAHGEPGSSQRVPDTRRPTVHDRILPAAMRRQFYPDTDDWKEAVLFRGHQIVRQAIAGIQRGAL